MVTIPRLSIEQLLLHLLVEALALTQLWWPLVVLGVVSN